MLQSCPPASVCVDTARIDAPSPARKPLSHARRRCLARRLASEFRETHFILRGEWWWGLSRLVAGQSLFSPQNPLWRGVEKGFNPDQTHHTPSVRRALRVLRRTSVDEQLDITMFALAERPHPSAWYLFALLCKRQPDSPWTRTPPRWSINTAWTGFPNEFCETTLHFACEFGPPDVVGCLVDRGADPNARDRFGQSPLHVLTQRRMCRFYQDDERTIADTLRIVDILLRAGADINATDRSGETPLFSAPMCTEDRDKFQLACGLVVRGADVAHRKTSGKTFDDCWRIRYPKSLFHSLIDACLLEAALKHGPGPGRVRL